MSTHRPSVLAVASAVVAVVLAGCAASPETGPAPQAQARTSPPADQTAIVEGDDPASLAIATTQALFDRAPVVALASEDDPAAQQRAGALTEQVGAPLLLVRDPGGSATPNADPASGPATAAADRAGANADLGAELARLRPAAVVPFTDPADEWATDAGIAPVVPAGGELPATSPAAPLAELLVLARDDDASLAATTTARATGARVLATDDPDPRRDPAVIESLAGDPPEQVAALGAEFGPAEQLRQRLDVAATGAQLPGGGQVVLPGRTMVALYGHPGSDGLGVLGEQPLADTVRRARQTAAEYEEFVDGPVVPTFEIITTVASGQAGPDGDYSAETPVADLRPWVDAAAEAGIYVVLDLQPGRTDFLSQAKRYEELLREPHVGLALDPEWRLAPDQVHLEQIGSVDAAEVNEVADWLATLTREHRLPQKLLVLHQFRLSMIANRAELRTDFDELAVLIHADGHGTKGQKLDTWRALRADPPPDAWWGWKNFYDEDRPTLTPAETVEIEPSPRFISYQ